MRVQLVKITNLVSVWWFFFFFQLKLNNHVPTTLCIVVVRLALDAYEGNVRTMSHIHRTTSHSIFFASSKTMRSVVTRWRSVARLKHEDTLFFTFMCLTAWPVCTFDQLAVPSFFLNPSKFLHSPADNWQQNQI